MISRKVLSAVGILLAPIWITVIILITLGGLVFATTLSLIRLFKA